uniref:Cytochrome P450, family 7, subfamily B, polypeptide 1 n=1 Tax=Salarias fasciatus TaxID=181472 RepID=A0A672HZK6_SALFA
VHLICLPCSCFFLSIYLLGAFFCKDEPPLIKGWIPFLGKALEFRKDAYKFLLEQKRKHGDIFTVRIEGWFGEWWCKFVSGNLNDQRSPARVRAKGQLIEQQQLLKLDQGCQTHFSSGAAFKLSVVGWFHIQQSYMICGENLTLLTESMMGNLMLVFRQDHLGHGGWRSESMYQFCLSVMFEATFLTMFGHPVAACRHTGVSALRDDFVKFNNKFPLLIINNTLSPLSAHHFAFLWASVGNTVPAMYYLVSHPEALQVVRQEIQKVLSLSGVEFSSDTDVKLHREQLDKLRYLGTLPSMRASVCPRTGDIIAMYPRTTHLDPEIYEEPKVLPVNSSWLKTDFYKDHQKLKYYLLAFGSGSSMCPGCYFAISEIKQFLCLLLLLYFYLQLEDGQSRVEFDPSRSGVGILPPSADVQFRYRPRVV